MYKQNGPGPGNYESSTFTSVGPKYTTRVKPKIDPLKNRTRTGPGDYTPQKPETKLSYSMGKKLEINKKQTPGPGSYNDMRQVHYNTITGSQIGKDERKSFFLVDSTYDSPIPGRYDLIQFGSGILGEPRCKFGVSSREINCNGNSPGPGSYQINTTLGLKAGTPVYSMPGRRKDMRPKPGVGVPGADAYHPSTSYISTKLATPKYSVGRQKKGYTGEKNFPLTPGFDKYFIEGSTLLTKTTSARWR